MAARPPPNVIPTRKVRLGVADLSPLVYVARSELAWAPNLVQGLAAVPQLSRLASLGDLQSDPEGMPLQGAADPSVPCPPHLVCHAEPQHLPEQLPAHRRRDRGTQQHNGGETGRRRAATRGRVDKCAAQRSELTPEKWMSHLPQILRDVIESRVALVQSNPDHELKATLSTMKFRDVLRSPEQ